MSGSIFATDSIPSSQIDTEFKLENITNKAIQSRNKTHSRRRKNETVM